MSHGTSEHLKDNEHESTYSGKALHSVSAIGHPETRWNFVPASNFPTSGQNKYVDPLSLDKNKEYDLRFPE